MAKKSVLVSAINGFLVIVVNILKVKGSFTEIINSVYAPTHYDNLVLQEQITAIPNPDILSGTLRLNLFLKRLGNEVIVTGRINNDTSGIVNNSKIFSINADSEYFPDDSLDPSTAAPIIFRLYAKGRALSGSEVKLIIRVEDGVAYFQNTSAIPVGEALDINGRYTAKD